MIRRGVAALAGGLLAVALAACADPPRDACELSTSSSTSSSSSALTAADRKLVGAADPYPADGMVRAREAELAGSQQARREVAWAAVVRALAPVDLAVDPGAGVPARLPRWHTWYGADDLRRLFDHLFRGLSDDARRARARFTDVELDQAFAWNPHAVEELPTWPEERWLDYVASLDSADQIAGVGGIDRVQYSPAAARHLLASYPEVVACADGAPVPPPVADAPEPGPRRMVRTTFDLDGCARRELGPYFVGDGERLTATVTGDALVQVRAGGRPADDRFDCEADTCDATGPAAVWIAVVAGASGATATLTVDYQEANPTWAACLAGGFPLDAAVVKADWRRAELGVHVPIHDTSAAGLRALLDGDADWAGGVGDADPGPDDIYTLELPTGSRYRLAGLHLMTKELDHWLWITLWWSPDPDRDFGADRPAAVTALGGPWRNYKMCVVTAFREGDPDPTGGVAPSSLAAALAAVHQPGGPSWCSNPMLEVGHGNAATNCIGCHQHGGTGLTSETILADDDRFPAHGRLQVRDNFPADYSWALDQGDRLGRIFADEVDYWTPPPATARTTDR